HFGGPAGMEKFLEGELQQPPEQVSIVMVSGRQTSRLTARGMIAVLRALKTEVERHGLKLEDIMPVACADYGTLRQRFAGTPLEGAVVGKTGTMTRDIDGGMATLAGIIYTERAGALLFAMLDQGGDIGKNRQLEDELLTEIASRYDVPRACLAAPRKLLPATELKVMSGE
ncbi:MAG: D-alanyl-D-alanine carboxypeptidase, partial [Acidobacteriota bacterium]|nr:D-alanyl-D-alanine carboxypeptidase [Acidobacteriota bacterium]